MGNSTWKVWLMQYLHWS